MGALEKPETCVTPPAEDSAPNASVQTEQLSDDPVLFRSSVQRSATFEGSPPAPNKIHRSETVPAATVASSLANLGSSIKLGFRYYLLVYLLYTIAFVIFYFVL